MSISRPFGVVVKVVEGNKNPTLGYKSDDKIQDQLNMFQNAYALRERNYYLPLYSTTNRAIFARSQNYEMVTVTTLMGNVYRISDKGVNVVCWSTTMIATHFEI
jgi:hypothetical protein